MKKRWYEITDNYPGIHAGTGLPMEKGSRHLLDPKLVGKNDIFKPVKGPHKKEIKPPASPLSNEPEKEENNA